MPTNALADRVVSMAVELDGKAVFFGETGDNGAAGPYTVWRYLLTTPLRPVEGYSVPAAPQSPLEALLRGKVRVKVSYGADVTAAELKLTRRQENSQEWYVDPTWVERVGPPGDTAEEQRRIAARSEELRKQWEKWKQATG